ncbi:SMI1/KNR4 family protein [Amycolatopsis sp. cmx-11-51]|uniref:SMI1/KNR4 family protein n=1 Tax=unclassified Amycolatopsis TaxID=2618356 RepID=UPI0039E2EA00
MADSRAVVDSIAAAVGWTDTVSVALDWSVVERTLGFSLPGDYKEFMERFPSAAFRDVVTFWNPIQGVESLARFREEIDRILIGVRIGWEREYHTFPPFPEPKGAIPFASDSGGGSLLWLPWTDDPDEWHVVYQSRHSPDDWTRTKRSMTEVMLELATSRSKRNILGWDMAAKERSLEPFEVVS